jgi:hypothetical protein
MSSQPTEAQQVAMMADAHIYKKNVLLKLTGAALVGVGIYSLYLTSKAKMPGAGPLIANTLSVLVIVWGLSLLMQPEMMTNITGKLISEVYPDFPVYGPADNGQLYGKNVMSFPPARDPMKQHEMFPFPQPQVLEGVGADGAFNAPAIVEKPMVEQQMSQNIPAGMAVA